MKAHSVTWSGLILKISPVGQSVPEGLATCLAIL